MVYINKHLNLTLIQYRVLETYEHYINLHILTFFGPCTYTNSEQIIPFIHRKYGLVAEKI